MLNNSASDTSNTVMFGSIDFGVEHAGALDLPAMTVENGALLEWVLAMSARICNADELIICSFISQPAVSPYCLPLHISLGKAFTVLVT